MASSQPLHLVQLPQTLNRRSFNYTGNLIISKTNFPRGRKVIAKFKEVLDEKMGDVFGR